MHMSVHSRASPFTHKLVSSFTYWNNKVIICANNQINNPRQ